LINNSIFKQVFPDDDLSAAVTILRESFGTVALDFGITPENCRSNPAFIDVESLCSQLNGERSFFLLYYNNIPVGSVAIEKSADQAGVFYIERVAVLPEYRHNGLGKELMHFATNRIISLGGRKVSVAIVNENEILKKWYMTQGFMETSIRKFDHLPFTVCFMYKLLGE
jgi:ribosomal protein S18 acetylase RimI-like enzyme